MKSSTQSNKKRKHRRGAQRNIRLNTEKYLTRGLLGRPAKSKSLKVGGSGISQDELILEFVSMGR